MPNAKTPREVLCVVARKASKATGKIAQASVVCILSFYASNFLAYLLVEERQMYRAQEPRKVRNFVARRALMAMGKHAHASVKRDYAMCIEQERAQLSLSGKGKNG